MAKTKPKESIVDFKKLLRELKDNPPARLYMLRGEEDYLRERYLETLRAKCVPEGLDSFNYHRITGPRIDLRLLSDALESMPFMGDHSLIEVRDFDINRTSDYDTEAFAALLQDIPDYATLAFVFSSQYAPDGRLSPVKALKKYGEDIHVTAQSESDLTTWILNFLKTMDKRCTADVASYIIYVCGTSLHTLKQELIKLAGLVSGDTITRADVDAVAKKQPETKAYELSDAIGLGQYDRAAKLLSELLSERDETPSGILYWVSEQMRRLYCARLAPRGEKGREYLTDCFPELVSKSFLIPKLQTSANRFSVPRLARAVEACAQCEFSMRDGGGTADADRLRELLLRLAMDTNDA